MASCSREGRSHAPHRRRGPDTSRLQRIAGALDLDGSVRFAGRVTDEQLAAAYASSSVFAMPGRHRLEPRPEGEGFGLVYVEAGAAGLPVIAGDGGGSGKLWRRAGVGRSLTPGIIERSRTPSCGC